MTALDLLTTNWLLALIITLILYLATLILQRLYFSPIAHIPGPKLAALTFWYEFYYDVIKQGRYTWKIAELHSEFGPIIRINPFEVHINDPEFYSELYSGRRDKWSWSAGMFGTSTGFFSTLPHDLHRRRRAPLNPFFSKASILRIQPMINKCVEQLSSRLERMKGKGEILNLRWAAGAISMDVVTEYSFGRSYECLEQEDFGCSWGEAIDSLSAQSHLNKQFPWLLSLMRLMPLWLVGRLNPHIMRLIRFQMDMAAQVATEMNKPPEKDDGTIFAALLKPGALPPSERTVSHLVDEAQAVIGAGQVTTTHYLNTVFYHILANPSMVSKLKAELVEVIPDPSVIPSLTKLERLPYLSAVVLEGYRISYGVVHRLQRISPDSPLSYQGTFIPAGTPVSMTSMLIHDNPDLFPEPREFKPERWLEPGAKEKLSNYLVNFSKGSRSCLGRELASAEIHLVLAVVLRRFELGLYETSREDVDVAHDYFNAMARKGAVGVRVLVK